MKGAKLCKVGFILFALSGCAHLGEAQQAEWTVMAFMNGDNNLQTYAVLDFLEMASVDLGDRVNVVVQLDRITNTEYDVREPGGTRTLQLPGWSQTLRFKVAKGLSPKPANALEDLGEQNMGDGAVLADFVAWARKKFPARKYALVVWDHGSGWRQLVPGAQNDQGAGPSVIFPFRSEQSEATYRAVSNDDTNHDHLYNEEARQGIEKALGSDRLDVLAFDACLMGMIETAYTFRSVAKVMVASEDLVPADGWDYQDWLADLAQAPQEFDAEKLGKLLVSSYGSTYGTGLLQKKNLTHAAVRLDKIDALSSAVSQLAESLIGILDTERAAVVKSRNACKVYAPDSICSNQPCFLNVDLGEFSRQLSTRVQNSKVREAASAVLSLLKEEVVTQRYTGSQREGDGWGSYGLAVYFPPDRPSYDRDSIHLGAYEKHNTAEFSVRFVNEHKWSDFLHAYMGPQQVSRQGGQP